MLTRATASGLRMAGLLGALIWPSLGWGQFVDCAGIEADLANKLVVGDVGLDTANEAASQARIERQRLENGVRQQIAELAFSPEGDVRLIPCTGHRPGTADFTRDIVESRYRFGVLVEFWGDVSATDAAFTFAVLPLLKGRDQVSMSVGFYNAGYAIEEDRRIDSVFREAMELRAFVALSAGLRMFDNAERTGRADVFGRAYQRLCQAHRLLDEAAHRSDSLEWGPTAAEWDALRGLALERAEAARLGAAVLLEPAVAAESASEDAGEACAVPPTDPVLPVVANLDRETRR